MRENEVEAVLPDFLPLLAGCDGGDFCDEILRRVLSRSGHSLAQVVGGLWGIEGKTIRIQVSGRNLQHGMGFLQRRRDVLGVPAFDDERLIRLRL